MGLRVGLTGGLGSGKSTVGAMLRDFGAYVLSADEMARKLQEPGQAVFAQIVRHFGPEVVGPDGALNRAALTRIAFADGRVEELNAIVHPATIKLQGEITAEIFRRDPAAIVVVESALIFETKYGDGWRQRFDRMILVTAPEESKVSRFVARSGRGDKAVLEQQARLRLAEMIPDEDKIAECDYVIRNDGSVEQLRAQVDSMWAKLAQ